MGLTINEKEALLGQLVDSPEGRAKIAQSMISPLRTKIDYRGVGRKALVVDPLPSGVLPYYDKDINVPSIVIAENGEEPEAVIRGERILVPMFELATNPKLAITQVKERKFAILRRTQDKAVQSIAELEDTRIFSAMEDAAAINDNTTINVSGYLDRDSLADAFAQVEQRRLRVAGIYMNPLDYSDIRKWGRDQLDIESQRELLQTGIMGRIWNAQITTTTVIPVGKVFVVCEPEFLGVMPVRIELTVWPADDPANRMIGWSIFEQVGIGIHNVNGVCDINITR
jgi:hypothetical protein